METVKTCYTLLLTRRGKIRIALELAVAYCAGIITSTLISKLASSSSLFSQTYTLLLFVLQSSTTMSTWLFSPWTWSLHSSQLCRSMIILFILILSSSFFYNYSRNNVDCHDDGTCYNFPSNIPPLPPSSQQPPILLIDEVESHFQDDVPAAAETPAAPVVTATVQVMASFSRSCANIIASNIDETSTPESSHDDLLHAFPFVSPPLIRLVDHHPILFNTNDRETTRASSSAAPNSTTENYEGKSLVGDISQKKDDGSSCCSGCDGNSSDQDNYSLEVIWNTINKEGTSRRKPKKSTTAAAAATVTTLSRGYYSYNVSPKAAAAAAKKNLKAWQELRKAETFNDAVFGWRRGGLRRGVSLTREEINLRAEAFIKNFKRHIAC